MVQDVPAFHKESDPMSMRSVGNGAAQAAGAQVTNAVLNTPQGHAAVVATAAAVVTAAPVVAVGALATGVVWGVVKFCEWLES
jgi:hypothetical protein